MPSADCESKSKSPNGVLASPPMTPGGKCGQNELEEEREPTDWRSIYIANLVAFLSAVKMSSIIPTIWPYLKLHVPNVNETYYGAIRGVNSLTNIGATAAAGFISNSIGNTKPCMMAGKAMAALACLVYLSIEIAGTSTSVVFVIYEALIGMGIGLASVFRTHIAMASHESERSRAFGLVLMSASLGFLCGPMLQMMFTLVGYPGISLPGGLHFNLFTAPIYLAFFFSIVSVALLYFFFNGKMRVPVSKQKEMDTELNSLRTDEFSSVYVSADPKKPKTVKYDKIAVVALIVIKVCADLNTLTLMSINTPYAMTVFEWSSADSVKFSSAFMAATGLCSLIFSFSYMRFKLDQKFSERFALFVAMLIFLTFYLVTYPWFFLPETIPYAHPKGATAFFDQTQAAEALANMNTTGVELVGCNVNYSWCGTTRRVNVYLYNAVLVLAMGVGMPMSHINMDILYSKVLGPIKQGVLQALSIGVGQVLHVIGPILFTQIYARTGPAWLWMLEIGVSAISLVTLALFYNRLVSFSHRVERKAQKHNLVYATS